jgi:hypothetical protein
MRRELDPRWCRGAELGTKARLLIDSSPFVMITSLEPVELGLHLRNARPRRRRKVHAGVTVPSRFRRGAVVRRGVGLSAKMHHLCDGQMRPLVMLVAPNPTIKWPTAYAAALAVLDATASTPRSTTSATPSNDPSTCSSKARPGHRLRQARPTYRGVLVLTCA